MERPQKIGRRQLLKVLTGGGTGMAALGTMGAAGAGVTAMMASAPNPLEAAQTATRRGLPRLKITDIKVIRTQVGNTHMCNAKVFTSEPGLYGVGDGNHAERTHIVAETIEKFLKPAVVGRYCDEIEDIWQMAWLAPYWRGSVDANNAMSCIDGALWDIFGKRAGVPVYNFLGGKVRPSLPMFANVGGASLQAQEDNARQAVENGYKYLRVASVGKRGNPGGGGRGSGAGGGGGQGNGPGGGGQGSGRGLLGQGNLPGGGGVGSPGFGERGPIYVERPLEIDYMTNLIESMEHLRNTIGFHTNMMAEVDSRLTPGNGLVLAKALEPFRMFWLEETFGPEDISWHEQMRAVSTTPIALGELFVSQAEWVPLVSRRLMDFMRMHISACGGLNMARKVASCCEFFGVRTAWHGPGNVSPVGHAVNMHIDLAVPNFGCGEGAPFNQTLRDLFPGCPERKNGLTIPNDLPGLGIDIDDAVAAKFESKTPGSDRGYRCNDGSPCRP
jgi:mannonate dehydratase